MASPTLNYKKLNTALLALEKAILVYNKGVFSDEDTENTIKAGVIQCFEFSYELSWKYMKKFLMQNYSLEDSDIVSRRALFKVAANCGVIESVETWLEFHEARNLTSHTYEMEVANKVLEKVEGFLAASQKLYGVLSDGGKQ